MSLSFSRDGTVLGTSELECRAKRNGMCQICGEVKTHEKQKKGFMKYEWVPLTVESDGSYEVYKGYCLHPRCYTLKQAKRALGEEKAIDRRRRRSHRSSRDVIQDTPCNYVSASSMYTSSSSLAMSDTLKAPSAHANTTASEKKPASGLYASHTTLETVSVSSRSSESSENAPPTSVVPTSASLSPTPVRSIRCIDVSGRRQESMQAEERDWEWDSTLRHSDGEGEAQEGVTEADIQSNGRQEESVVNVSEIRALITQIGGDVECVVEVIANFMESNPRAEDIQSYCLTTISGLSKNNEANKDVIMSSGAPARILSAMSNHSSSASVLERACTALWSLAVKKEHRQKLIKSGACVPVLKVIEDHLSEKSVVERALGALLTFSSEPECRIDLRMRQAKKLVLQAMKSHLGVSSIQRDGCILLSNMVVDVASHNVSVVTHEDVEAVIHAIENHKSSAPVIRGACFALTNFMHNKNNLKSATELDLLITVSDDVFNEIHDEEAKQAVDALLFELRARRAAKESIEDSVSSSLLQKMHRSENGETVGLVLKTMQDYEQSEKVTCSGLQCFWLVANEQSIDRDSVLDGKIVQGTISAMRRHSGSPDIQEKGCELLECLARGSAAETSTIVQAGGSRAIVAAIREHQENERVQRSAFEALYVLSDDFECWFDIEQDGGIEEIKQAVKKHRNSAVVQRRGRSILSNFNAQSCRF